MSNISLPQWLVSSTSQRDAEKQGCSNGTSANWLKLEHAICPHQEDYGGTCAKAI